MLMGEIGSEQVAVVVLGGHGMPHFRTSQERWTSRSRGSLQTSMARTRILSAGVGRTMKVATETSLGESMICVVGERERKVTIEGPDGRPLPDEIMIVIETSRRGKTTTIGVTTDMRMHPRHIVVHSISPNGTEIEIGIDLRTRDGVEVGAGVDPRHDTAVRGNLHDRVELTYDLECQIHHPCLVTVHWLVV